MIQKEVDREGIRETAKSASVGFGNVTGCTYFATKNFRKKHIKMPNFDFGANNTPCVVQI